jgi:rare lipoprotein A
VSWRAAAGLLLLAALAGCAHLPPPGPPGDGGRDGAQVGLASFYGRRHQGRATASGAPFDPQAFTCAHRTAPFGARLRVTDLASGRSVVVTVTDRGPAVEARVVDLSLAAARALGMLERGVARVRIERVE